MRVRGARVLVLLVVLGGCGSAFQLPLTVEARGGGLVVELTGVEGARLVLLAGPVWSGTEPLPEEHSELLLAGPGASELLTRNPAPGQSVSATLPGARLEGLPDPCGLQLVAVGPDGTPVGASQLVVVERADGGFVVGSLLESIAGAAVRTLLLLAVVPLVVVGLLSRGRWPARLPGAAGTAVLVAGALAVLAGRLLDEPPVRLRAERGLAPPPLVWPADWELDGEGSERILGPGFEQLVESIEGARDGDEPLTVWCKPRGMSLLRAAHLAHRTGGTVRRHTGSASPVGLNVFCEVPPAGAVLLQTEAGVLTRAGETR